MQDTFLDQLRADRERLASSLEASTSRIEELESDVQLLEATNEARSCEYAALGKSAKDTWSS